MLVSFISPQLYWSAVVSGCVFICRQTVIHQQDSPAGLCLIPLILFLSHWTAWAELASDLLKNTHTTHSFIPAPALIATLAQHVFITLHHNAPYLWNGFPSQRTSHWIHLMADLVPPADTAIKESCSRRIITLYVNDIKHKL